MAIIIERTITINNDKATLDKPIYFYIGDGNITCLFTIKEIGKTARFGKVNDSNIIQENDSIDYGEARIYKPSKDHAETARAEIIDDKLQIEFNFDNIDDYSEAGVHKLQIHLYDNATGDRNRLTIPPIDINVLMPIGLETNLIDEAIVDYSILDAQAEDVPAFDEEGNYNKTVWQRGDIITQDKLNKLEDALYEINAADSNFITNEQLDIALTDKADEGHKHKVADITGLHRVATSGSYNDLSNKPSMATYATKTELSNKADKTHTHTNYADATHTHNEYAVTDHTHTGYATSAELFNKADKGHTHNYLTQDALTNYATKSYVDNQGFITSIPSAYVTESELQNTLANKAYATISYVDVSIKNAGGFSGSGGSSEGLDLTIYATKDQLYSELATKADTEHTHAYLVNVPDKYATKDYVNEAIENASIGGGTINPDDLADYATKDEMAVALIGKSNIDHAHDDKYAVYNHTHDYYALKSDIPNMVEVPTNVGAFTNDVGYVTETVMNEAISDINESVNNIDQNLNDYALKTDIPTVPTDVSAFTNDVGYALKSDIPTVPTDISAFTNDVGYVTSNVITRIEIVDEIPENEVDGVLYIIKA